MISVNAFCAVPFPVAAVCATVTTYNCPATSPAGASVAATMVRGSCVDAATAIAGEVKIAVPVRESRRMRNVTALAAAPVRKSNIDLTENTHPAYDDETLRVVAMTVSAVVTTLTVAATKL